jgi:phosphoadenosine phosphosulfate reductase
MIKTYGPNLFYQSVELRRLCCKIRKVDSLKRALSGLDAWITGLRHEQSSERAKLKKIERDLRNNCLKINPILEWSYDQVWNYVKKRGLPYNELHDKGYPSIGCAPCTRPAESSGSRDGRWFWESSQTKECGLHK